MGVVFSKKEELTEEREEIFSGERRKGDEELRKTIEKS